MIILEGKQPCIRSSVPVQTANQVDRLVNPSLPTTRLRVNTASTRPVNSPVTTAAPVTNSHPTAVRAISSNLANTDSNLVRLSNRVVILIPPSHEVTGVDDKGQPTLTPSFKVEL